MTSKFLAPVELFPAEDTRQSGGSFLLWYQTMVLAAALAAIYANLPIYAYFLNPGLLPKFTYFGIFFLVAPLIVLKSRSFGAYLLSPFVRWAACFLVLNLIHLGLVAASNSWDGIYVYDIHSDARQALIATRIQYLVFAVFLGFVAYISPYKNYLYVIVALMIVLPCAVVLDFARPGLLYPIDTEGAVLGRAAAMFINPTAAGEAILLVFLIGCSVIKAKYRVAFFALSGAAVVTTFSRSSIIAWVLLLFILVFKRSLPKSAFITFASVFALSLALLGSFENYVESRQELAAGSSNILSRLDFFSSFEFNDDSSEERAGVIQAGWDLFLQNPVFGAGAGATHFWSHRGSTHNQLLLLAAEYGFLGVVLWIWLLVILWKGKFFAEKGLQVSLVFLFVFMSLFTHQMFDAASYWLATFALMSIRKNKSLAKRDSARPFFKIFSN